MARTSIHAWCSKGGNVTNVGSEPETSLHMRRCTSVGHAGEAALCARRAVGIGSEGHLRSLRHRWGITLRVLMKFVGELGITYSHDESLEGFRRVTNGAGEAVSLLGAAQQSGMAAYLWIKVVDIAGDPSAEIVYDVQLHRTADSPAPGCHVLELDLTKPDAMVVHYRKAPASQHGGSEALVQLAVDGTGSASRTSRACRA